MSIANSRRREDMLYCDQRGKVRKIVRAILLGAVTFGAPSLLRGQDPAPTQNLDSRPLELHRTSESISQPNPQDYLISPDDQLEIYVLDVPEISRPYRVSPSGSITLALLPDPISAAGLTPAQLSQVVGERLRAAGMVSNPRVTLQVKESRVHSIAITGAVKKPQIYALFDKTTLLDALSQAEGLDQDAGNTAIITRGATGLRALRSDLGAQVETGGQPAAPQIVRIDLRGLFEDGDTSLNLDLYPGDRVTVQRAGIVYVVGAVNRAGGFVLKDDRQQMTVLKAIALAESLKSTATPRKAIIIRKNLQASAVSQEIPVDLSKILSGHTPDLPLLAGDILFVPDSTTKKALHRAGEAAAQAAALFVYRVP